MLIPKEDGLYCGNCGAPVPLEKLYDVYENPPQKGG
jgi:hypothetical protein